MTTRSILGALLLLGLATACGGGNGNNDTCGDGHTTGSEQCDDGNTTSGDGCSSTCKTEAATHCGDGVVDVATEQCDDGNTSSGDGCSATCQNEASALCGNGQINGAEACDDGNTSASDGCSATCTVEAGYTCTGTPSVCTMISTANGTCATPFNVTFTGTTTLTATLTGDTTTSTSQVGTATCDGFADEGLGKDHIYKFTTTDVRDVKIEIAAATAFGAIIRLLRAPCDLAMEIPEYTGAADGCADIDGSGFLGYVNLPAGTYYVVVDGYAAGEEGAYEVDITASMPGCGNGVGDPTFEFCDDGNTASGDGCSANCEIETGYNCITPAMGAASVCHLKGCGDGIVDDTMNEECDDLNTVSGDRCSATCLLESDVTEAAEPNDTVPQVVTAQNHLIRGALADATDVDLYSFTLLAPATVEIETYDTIDGTSLNYANGASAAVGFDKLDCYTVDTVAALYAAGADVTNDAAALARDDDDGSAYCSYLGSKDSVDNVIETGADPTQLVNLPAGTYTLRISNYATPAAASPGRYIVDLKIGTPTTTAVPPAPGDIIINEFMAADGPVGTGADTNCDGSFTSNADEFIEFVNVSNKMLDLTGLTIKDGGTVMTGPVLQHTFAAAASGSMTLLPGKAVVVWGGGTPACAGVTNWFVASNGQLSLNDAGDTITLATGGASPVTIAQFVYGQATIGVSFNLNPDATTGTTYALHNAVTGHVGNFSPGKKVNGTAF